jgi:DNA-binding Xre family transcriptional regulator
MMRLRLPELLKERALTPYALGTHSGGRISLPMAYRLARAGGRFVTIKADVLDALCDVLDVEPGALLERTPAAKRARTGTRAKGKRSTPAKRAR